MGGFYQKRLAGDNNARLSIGFATPSIEELRAVPSIFNALDMSTLRNPLEPNPLNAVSRQQKIAAGTYTGGPRPRKRS